jgi:hypothetical protein
MEVFKTERQLVVIEPFGAPAKLAALGLLNDEPEAFDLRLRLSEVGAFGREREREHRTLQAAVLAQGGNMPDLAKDVIEQFMQVAVTYAKHYALSEKDLDHTDAKADQAKREWKQNKFQDWARLAVGWATDLAPYQSPTFRAISISHQKDEEDDRGTTVLHSMEQVREVLLLRGVTPEQLGRALIGPPPIIEHDDHGEKKR